MSILQVQLIPLKGCPLLRLKPYLTIFELLLKILPPNASDRNETSLVLSWSRYLLAACSKIDRWRIDCDLFNQD